MKITVYSTPTCPFCKQVKAFLDSRNVSYTDIDVSADQAKAQEMIEKSSQMGVPVTEIDGELVIGFDKKKIEELLDKAK
ncbi:glutaredoxin family protein [Candidatus Uhrbacteria bacterium]|jgi:glutaredoxin 3|nr:glutaredoxin family protein [Candidatus Uhrbacteria bacterium]